ncbi:MAG: hypothetical protein J5800_05470 [Spirochaetales bacterium]|nr:hypothetical protein [Spirochaetales bacterium]
METKNTALINSKSFIPESRFFSVPKATIELLSEDVQIRLKYTEEMTEDLSVLGSLLDNETNKMYSELVEKGFCKNIVDLLVLGWFYSSEWLPKYVIFNKLKGIMSGNGDVIYPDDSLTGLLSCTYGFFVSRKQYNKAMSDITDIPESACNIIRRELAKTPSAHRAQEERIIKRVIISQAKAKIGEDRGKKIYDVFFDASKLVTPSILYSLTINEYFNYLACYCKYRYPEVFANTIGPYCI